MAAEKRKVPMHELIFAVGRAARLAADACEELERVRAFATSAAAPSTVAPLAVEYAAAASVRAVRCTHAASAVRETVHEVEQLAWSMPKELAHEAKAWLSVAKNIGEYADEYATDATRESARAVKTSTAQRPAGSAADVAAVAARS